MSDWTEATDPVPARREFSEEEKLAKIKRMQRTRLARGWVKLNAQSVSTHYVSSDFDEMGA